MAIENFTITKEELKQLSYNAINKLCLDNESRLAYKKHIEEENDFLVLSKEIALTLLENEIDTRLSIHHNNVVYSRYYNDYTITSTHCKMFDRVLVFGPARIPTFFKTFEDAMQAINKDECVYDEMKIDHTEQNVIYLDCISEKERNAFTIIPFYLKNDIFVPEERMEDPDYTIITKLIEKDVFNKEQQKEIYSSQPRRKFDIEMRRPIT